MKFRFISMSAIALLFVGALLAQPAATTQPHMSSPSNSGQAKARREHQKLLREEALVAFKQGDTPRGLACVDALAQFGLGKAHVDLQTAHELMILGLGLKREGDKTHADAIASLAVGRLAEPQGRMRSKDTIAALTMRGEIHEYILGDSVGAITAYEAVLALDPANEHATQRRSHLKAIEEHAALKAAGNAVLRQRAAQAEILQNAKP